MRLVRRTQGASLIVHLLAARMIRLSSTELAHAAAVSTSSAELRAALAQMQTLDPMVNHDILWNCELLDRMGCIRYAHKGEQVDFRNVHSKRDLYILLFGKEEFDRVFWYTPAFGEAMLVWMAALIAVPNKEEALAREHWAIATFDLAKLSLAQRLDQLTSGSEAASSATGQLRARLRDPFSAEPYLWNSERECFYSVGPDRFDSQMRDQADAPGGLVQFGIGDIWISPEQSDDEKTSGTQVVSNSVE